MKVERIEVVSYSGSKSDERPMTFVLRGLRIDVLEITDHWIEESHGNRARRRFFRIRGSDGGSHRIFTDERSGEWYLAT